MPFGYRLWWAQESMCYIGCTLAQPGEYDRTVLCSGDAAFFQATLITYFGYVYGRLSWLPVRTKNV